MRIFVTIMTVEPGVLSSLGMQFNKHAVVLCLGGNVGECRTLTSFFRGRTRFPQFLMLPLSFNTNYRPMQWRFYIGAIDVAQPPQIARREGFNHPNSRSGLL